MKRLWMASCLFVLGGLLQSGCLSLPYIRAEGGYFRPVLDAQVTGSAPGDKPVDLEAVANIPSEEDAPFGAAAVEIGPIKVLISGWQASMSCWRRMPAIALATATCVKAPSRSEAEPR